MKRTSSKSNSKESEKKRSRTASSTNQDHQAHLARLDETISKNEKDLEAANKDLGRLEF